MNLKQSILPPAHGQKESIEEKQAPMVLVSSFLEIITVANT